jgi:hypothetical protein
VAGWVEPEASLETAAARPYRRRLRLQDRQVHHDDILGSFVHVAIGWWPAAIFDFPVDDFEQPLANHAVVRPGELHAHYDLCTVDLDGHILARKSPVEFSFENVFNPSNRNERVFGPGRRGSRGVFPASAWGNTRVLIL